MAAVRSSTSASSSDDAPLAKKKIAKKKIIKKSVVKKATAKKTVTKKATAKTIGAKKKVAKAKSSRPPVIRPTQAELDAIAPEPERPPRPSEPRTPRPRKRSPLDRINDPPPASGIELITRVTSAIERELNQIEVIVGGHRIRPSERTEGERRARTLASLARTLSEVARLRAQHQQKADDDDHDIMPRDLDELRETLARRLEKLLTDPSQPADRQPEPQ